MLKLPKNTPGHRVYYHGSYGNCWIKEFWRCPLVCWQIIQIYAQAVREVSDSTSNTMTQETPVQIQLIHYTRWIDVFDTFPSRTYFPMYLVLYLSTVLKMENSLDCIKTFVFQQNGVLHLKRMVYINYIIRKENIFFSVKTCLWAITDRL